MTLVFNPWDFFPEGKSTYEKIAETRNNPHSQEIEWIIEGKTKYMPYWLRSVDDRSFV